jgi:hypothetical protein
MPEPAAFPVLVLYLHGKPCRLSTTVKFDEVLFPFGVVFYAGSSYQQGESNYQRVKSSYQWADFAGE